MEENKVLEQMTEEELQEYITEIAFEVIASVGTAKGNYMEAIQLAKQGKYEDARAMIKEGKAVFVEGHHAHAKILEAQGNGIKLPFNIYLMHAEDQMMAADSFEILAEEFIQIYEYKSNK